MLFGPPFCGTELGSPDGYTYVRLLLIAPILEEFVLRAGLQEYLIRKNWRKYRFMHLLPIMLPAVLFGLIHARQGAAVVVLMVLPGLALGWLYQRTRNWGLSALAHSLMNLCALAVCTF
jgi:membrane protease YdiL (CAAX protease family)